MANVSIRLGSIFQILWSVIDNTEGTSPQLLLRFNVHYESCELNNLYLIDRKYQVSLEAIQ